MGVGALSIKHPYSVGNGGIVAVVDEVCLPVRRKPCDRDQVFQYNIIQ